MEGIQKLINGIEIIRELNPKLASQHLVGILYIAQNEGLGILDLAKHIQVSSGAASRFTYMLMAPSRRNQGLGFGLVYLEEDEADARYKHIYLTNKGRDLIARVLAAIK